MNRVVTASNISWGLSLFNATFTKRLKTQETFHTK